MMQQYELFGNEAQSQGELPPALPAPAEETVTLPDMRGLSQRFELAPILAAQNIESRPGQIRYLLQFLPSQGNVVLWADTNSGKTYALLIGAVPVLKRAERVLVLTPTVELTAQGVADAAKVLSLEGRSCAITGADSSSAARAAKFNDKSNNLIFATPEVIMNDIMRGAISLSGVGMVILDEADRLTEGNPLQRKNTLYKFVRWLEGAHPEVRIVAASATFDTNYFLEFMELLRANGGFRMESERESVPHQICNVSLEQDADLYRAKHLLERAGEDHVQHIVDRLLMASAKHRPSTDERSATVALQKFIVEAAYEAKKDRTFTMPAQGVLIAMREQLDSLRGAGGFNATEQRLLGEATVRLCALGHIRRHHANLSTSSKHSFLRYCAERLAQVNYLPPEDSPIYAFHRGLYTFRSAGGNGSPSSHELLLQAFQLAANGSLFTEFSDRERLQRFALSELPPGENGNLANQKKLALLLDSASKATIASPRSDHPKEDFLMSDLRGWFSRSDSARVIIFTELASTVKFIVQRLNASGIFPPAVARAGREHMSVKERTANLAALRNGEASIGVCTSVAELGEHVHGTDLVINHTPPTSARQLLQRIGRATPDEGHGYSISYIATGTQDVPQLRAALAKAGKMKRRLPALVAQRYFEWGSEQQ